MNWPALAAAVIAACVAVIFLVLLAGTAFGIWCVWCAVHDWAAEEAERRQRTATRTRQQPHTPTWSTTVTIRPAPVAAYTEPSGDEPDLTDPHCGTDDQLLQTVRDIWRQPTREEDQK